MPYITEHTVLHYSRAVYQLLILVPMLPTCIHVMVMSMVAFREVLAAQDWKLSPNPWDCMVSNVASNAGDTSFSGGIFSSGRFPYCRKWHVPFSKNRTEIEYSEMNRRIDFRQRKCDQMTVGCELMRLLQRQHFEKC